MRIFLEECVVDIEDIRYLISRRPRELLVWSAEVVKNAVGLWRENVGNSSLCVHVDPARKWRLTQTGFSTLGALGRKTHVGGSGQMKKSSRSQIVLEELGCEGCRPNTADGATCLHVQTFGVGVNPHILLLDVVSRISGDHLHSIIDSDPNETDAVAHFIDSDRGPIFQREPFVPMGRRRWDARCH